jgi:peroxiredoxin
MSSLKNGDQFPRLVVKNVAGGAIRLPEDLAGSYGVVLIYRGAWCPLCREQLAEYAAAKSAFDDLGVKIVALSVDDATASAKLVAEQHLPFLVGYGLDAAEISAATGAFTNPSPNYLQPTNYILSPEQTIMSALYSTHAFGRLSAADVKRFVAYVKSKQKAA